MFSRAPKKSNACIIPSTRATRKLGTKSRKRYFSVLFGVCYGTFSRFEHETIAKRHLHYGVTFTFETKSYISQTKESQSTAMKSVDTLSSFGFKVNTWPAARF